LYSLCCLVRRVHDLARLYIVRLKAAAGSGAGITLIYAVQFSEKMSDLWEHKNGVKRACEEYKQQI
jgi:hypothetical protein